MAYRRRQGNPRASTFEDFRSAAPEESSSSSSYSPAPSSLAAAAIRASSAHRDSSISSAYGESAVASGNRESNRQRPSPSPRDSAAFEYTSMKSLNESKYGFWGVLARKAKALIDEDNAAQKAYGVNQPQMVEQTAGGQLHQSHRSPESYRKTETPFQKSSDSIASSLNAIGGTIKKSLEEGLTIVENRTADIIQETRKLHIRRKGSGPNAQNQATDKLDQHFLPQIQADYETQLKASRDVANAMAAKAKLLLRELKTVKADLAFAKERCAQLEEENKMLRESREKGDNLEDDDLIRLQLETLLAEKGRLAHENSVYARENRFLREIVEYHQLTMQDVVYVDEGIEEVSEVFCPPQIPATPTPPTPQSNANSNQSNSSVDATLKPLTPTNPPPSLLVSTIEVVPEACPIIPTPPSLSRATSMEVASPKKETASQGEVAKQSLQQ